MKTTPRHNSQGSTLVMTIITCALVGTILSSYLALIANRNVMAMRATAWNSAIPVLEAGIEEALTHLHFDSNSPAINGWQQVDGQQSYWKHGKLPDGSYYFVTNFNVNSPSPYIHSAGHVRAPLKDNEFIARIVEVTTTNPPSQYNYAIAANGQVRLSGNALVDGFSTAGFNSVAEAYSTSTNRTAEGGIATNSKEIGAIDIGSGDIVGYAITGPGGTVVASGGTVGDVGWSSSGSGIQSGWANNNMNVQFQPNSPPSGTMAITQIQGTTNTLTTGSYQMPSFVSNDATRPMIINGDVTLWVTANFIVNGSGYVYISPGSSLKLYVGVADPTANSTTSISGQGVVNGTGLAVNFSYYGLPSNKTLNYSGSADFIGTVNAPQAHFTLSGNASVYGAIICDSFNSTGNSSVHYDRALAGGGLITVIGWREL